MTHRCRVYGLNIASDLPLYQHRPPIGGRVDVVVSLAEPIAPPSGRPGGRPILHLETTKQYYTVTETEGGYVARFYGSCDVLLDRSLSRLTVHPVAGVDPELLSVLVAGTGLALLLTLRGETLLHASAAQVDQGAVAFVGGSGMGKSTMATLLCARGARLITDDLLRLRRTDEGIACELGASELRLRKSATELASRFEVRPSQRRTGDDRDALATLAATEEGIPLRALLVPIPDKAAALDAVAVTRLSTSDALLLLSRFPRLLGWTDKPVLRRQFEQLADIVSRVPVHVVELPWGPPFHDEIVATLLDRLGLSLDLSAAAGSRAARIAGGAGTG